VNQEPEAMSLGHELWGEPRWDGDGDDVEDDHHDDDEEEDDDLKLI